VTANAPASITVRRISAAGDSYRSPTTDTLVITRRWRNSENTPLALFGCVFIGLLFGLTVWTSVSSEPSWSSIGWLAILIVTISYVLLVPIVNRSVITLARDELRIREGPLPFWDPRSPRYRVIAIGPLATIEVRGGARRYWICIDDGPGVLEVYTLDEAQFIAHAIAEHAGVRA
jgi:hypothetical protein